ncbi:uncharacterized protein ACLA_023800 [Aspergillus clavatus NRRL 1]|uniref:Pyridine nucleotide-disulphide oxidoreductase, putative n=1 Tax=Aspergillus clavatus (strain ATCC 1007 / CBS 513.65 / DSM 816 / NCTC 3887 / NRRL 1 / QM 1276 / 107) TaxID=344612 RepID=A1CPU5_ASPCL|nr:pyridine nucleotide-disulfide oxidoreductase, putative [Aspergillus clavatus NRRL 1]EAW07666.1 pyridine nucleotide-disulphide oxidoreductase, putative [Aspergillus clavatus NRRL 1]
MARPKKVAVIGAGPSGLVTAKTLLHQFPEGTFAPTIFEKRPEIGGLWPARHDRRSRSTVNPLMRTNLSRFTVSFSDLAWESVVGDAVPTFPRAWQVGLYLEKYAERYLPAEVVRLGHEVVGVSRARVDGRPRWTVQWRRHGYEDGVQADSAGDCTVVGSEEFDFLVVASGYFARPYCPDIPGLDAFADRTIHSFALRDREDLDGLVNRAGPDGGKLVVIGGSMSGAEAASALALHVSSSRAASGAAQADVHHVCSRPFWTVPTHLPHTRKEDAADTGTVSLLPLDLAMYDLARRPPGPVEYAFGPVSSTQVARVNDYFHSVLGGDYASIGVSDTGAHDDGGTHLRPSWVAIGNDYAEFVRSGIINPTFGRVCAVHRSSENRTRIEIEVPGKDRVSLENVAGIILATGFTPFASLGFLPDEVLQILDYSANDSFFPLLLDGKGTSHAEIPDLGFVGFYRGPYWGVMEMQARSLAKSWAEADTEHGIEFSTEQLESKATERQRVREYRQSDPNLHRGQFPMGDYTGLMESFARDLGISRASLLGFGERDGPVVPARYIMRREGNEEGLGTADVQITLNAMSNVLISQPASAGSAIYMAIFRALHGAWSLMRTSSTHKDQSTGIATFHPRYPSEPAYEAEYLYEEAGTDSIQAVYRLAESPGDAKIIVSPVDRSQSQAVAAFSHALSVTEQEFQSTEGKYSLHATSTGFAGSDSNHSDASNWKHDYVFRFDGVAISSWTCTVWRPLEQLNPYKEDETVTTLYRRL